MVVQKGSYLTWLSLYICIRGSSEKPDPWRQNGYTCSLLLLFLRTSFFLLQHLPGRTGNPRSACPGRDCYLLLPECESVTLFMFCQSPYYLFVSWTFRRKAFFSNASPELTRYGPVVTVRFTRFNTQKFYVLPTQYRPMYLFVWISEQAGFVSPYSVNSLDFILRRIVCSCAVRTEYNW